MRQNFKTLMYGIYLTLAAAGGLAAVIALLAEPASEKNRVLGTLSWLQLLVAGSHLFVIAIIVFIGWKFVRGAPAMHTWVDALEAQPSRWLAGLMIGVTITWALFSLQIILPHSVSPYLDRLKFQINWMRGLAIGWLILWWLRNLSHMARSGEGLSLRKSLVWLLVLTLPGIVIWITGIGMNAKVTDPPAVHFSYAQLLIVILAICSAMLIIGLVSANKPERGKKPNWLHFALMFILWLVAAIVWNRIEFTGSFNAMGPYPPNGDLVPFGDSIRFDLPGQSALVGMGFDRGLWVDNPLYSLFLMILRAIAGQSYHQVMFLQVLVLALTPVFIYLIGKELGSSIGGLGGALLVIFRDANILSQIKDHYWLIPVKVMATEPFVTLVMAATVYCLILWLKDPKRQVPLYLSGALFGFSTLVRHNTWFFMLALFLVVFLRQRKDWRRALASMTLLGVFIGTAILPWTWRTQQVFGSPFYMVIRFMGTVEARYPGQSQLAPTPPVDEQPEAQWAKAAKAVPSGELLPRPDDGQVASYLAGHLFFHYANSYYLLPGLHLLPGEEALTVFPKQIYQAWRQASPPIAVLYLVWWGWLTWLVAFGLVKSLKKSTLAGLLPLLYLLSYTLGNVAAGTSGSRYSQPFDWVILLYLAIGFSSMLPPQQHLTQLTAAKPTTRTPKKQKSLWIQGMAVWLAVFLSGALLLVADGVFPQRYREPAQAGDLPAIYAAYGDRIEAYRTGNGDIHEGRLIWAMFNKQQENNPFVQDTFDNRDRLTFKLVGDPNLPGRGKMFILPLGADDWFDEFLAGKDVLVLACPGDPHKAAQVHALGVVIDGEPQWIEPDIPCQKP
ncbi:MAG: hypothetical protein HPY76_00530 [Anaerolineae bacterium]|nr:hypothetical protein [Anaerolineae bacterium]